MARITKERPVEARLCSEKHSGNVRCFWVIMRDDGRAVWDMPHKNKESCLAEISFHNLSGYHPEHRIRSQGGKDD